MLLRLFQDRSIYVFKIIFFGLLYLSVHLDKAMETRFIALGFFSLLKIICVEKDFFFLQYQIDMF